MSHSPLEPGSHESPGARHYPPFTADADLEAAADERISHYPESLRSAVLPLLHMVQHRFGYISAGSIQWVAGKLSLEPIRVLG